MDDTIKFMIITGGFLGIVLFIVTVFVILIKQSKKDIVLNDIKVLTPMEKSNCTYTTTGTIKSICVIRPGGGKTYQAYCLVSKLNHLPIVLKIQYDVYGNKFTIKEVIIKPTMNNSLQAICLCQKVTVYYNPCNPQVAFMLENANSSE